LTASRQHAIVAPQRRIGIDAHIDLKAGLTDADYAFCSNSSDHPVAKVNFVAGLLLSSTTDQPLSAAQVAAMAMQFD